MKIAMFDWHPILGLIQTFHRMVFDRIRWQQSDYGTEATNEKNTKFSMSIESKYEYTAAELIKTLEIALGCEADTAFTTRGSSYRRRMITPDT